MLMDLFTPTPTFTHNGETLPVTEIAKTKHITSLTVAYLSKGKRVKMGGIRGFFGATKIVQTEKELTITDEGGIKLYYIDGLNSAAIHFSEKKEFEKLSDNDYDEDTLSTSFVMTLVQPYRIHFPIESVKKIAWV